MRLKYSSRNLHISVARIEVGVPGPCFTKTVLSGPTSQEVGLFLFDGHELQASR
jgi:hypothetical protein